MGEPQQMKWLKILWAAMWVAMLLAFLSMEAFIWELEHIIKVWSGQ